MSHRPGLKWWNRRKRASSETSLLPYGESPAATAETTIDDDARPGRLAIVSLQPTVSAGAFSAKRVVGDALEISAVVVCDGAVDIGAEAHVTTPTGTRQVSPMVRGVGYEFSCRVPLTDVGIYAFRVEAWIDQAATVRKKIVRKAVASMATANEEWLLAQLGDEAISDRVVSAQAAVVVDRPLAASGAWYEFFPRSTGAPGAHGTLRTAIERLDYVKGMGFDIVYVPPIHPIGRSHRKGPDNTTVAGPDDVGSPWAIGAIEGGHTAVHPQLGTIEDFDDFVAAARTRGLEVAIDIAFQCSPDHPWVTEHPEWFSVWPDGSIAFAENPPKQYQDIVPFNFESSQWRALWNALADVVRFWTAHGVRTFRVDNPHTKPFAFWEWLIAELKKDDPGLIFLAEAFAHPDVMFQLSRVGFSLSYTHFPWQHSPAEIESYFELLTGADNVDFFRGSAWPNTPDILTEELQQGVRQVFVERFILAATLSASYGLYGPLYELQVHDVREGSEEYAHGEKYELRWWDVDNPNSLSALIRTVNDLRRSHAALWHDRSLRFHGCANPRMVAYSKTAPATAVTTPKGAGGDGLPAAGADPSDASRDPILVVCNTDHWNAQESIVHLSLEAFDADFSGEYEAHDLLTGVVYMWRGADNYVRLDPWSGQSAHVFALRLPAQTQVAR